MAARFQPLPGGGFHGDLPDGWIKSLTHEVALALSMPAVSANKLLWLAWNLQAALPGTGDLLAAGELTLARARAVDTALGIMGDMTVTGIDGAPSAGSLSRSARRARRPRPRYEPPSPRRSTGCR